MGAELEAAGRGLLQDCDTAPDAFAHDFEFLKLTISLELIDILYIYDRIYNIKKAGVQFGRELLSRMLEIAPNTGTLGMEGGER